MFASVPGKVALTVSLQVQFCLTRHRACVGLFQIPVWTVRPFQAMSRGVPTFTESSRAMTSKSLPNG